MTGFAALLDSNVVVASLMRTHEHHDRSAVLLTGEPTRRFAVAAHSFAEAFATLTRAGASAPFRIEPMAAIAMLDSVRALTGLVGLTPAQSVEAIGRFARQGGIGPRLYDALIGEAAVVNAIPIIITWNTRHLAGLFPDRQVITPAEFPGAGRAQG